MGDYLTDHDPCDGERVPDLPEWGPEMTEAAFSAVRTGPVQEGGAHV